MVYPATTDALKAVVDIDLEIGVGDWSRVRLPQHVTLYQTLQEGVLDNALGISCPSPGGGAPQQRKGRHSARSSRGGVCRCGTGADGSERLTVMWGVDALRAAFGAVWRHFEAQNRYLKFYKPRTIIKNFNYNF